MQTFIYKIIPDKERRGFEANFDLIWSTIQMGKDKLNLIKKPKDETRKKVLSGFLRTFRASSGSFKQHWIIFHSQGDYYECIPKSS